ncbi:lipid-binding SYLF domain-containing protein [Roseateles oligotrophus]|uniref:Lipid-binding SYLF domain-containing protein n=1 Tax=Roseateles oligotrophus TaxID=1769250 RepID=A0ABT2YLK7_9BURK|nr:lipid-binding SYLF domain-containing protein [Roseateles oligotrophus]MCV2370942.1 lipid-binding SYLF domain-containing protein [Roseateles oligotrophus]
MNIAIRKHVFPLAVAAIAVGFFIGSPSAQAADKAEAESLVAKSAATIKALANDPDFASMKSELAKAHAVLIFPQVLKAGFFLGGAGGNGVLMARDGNTGAWVGPAFYTMGAASLGLQAGASSAEMVMLVNSQKALDSLYTNKVKLGADVTAALGSKAVGKNLSLNADFVVYSKAKGAFAGIAVDGAVLDVRRTINAAYYEQAATPIDILVKRIASNADANGLQAALQDAAK